MNASNNRIQLAIVAMQIPPIGGGFSERLTGFIKQWSNNDLIEISLIAADPEGLGYPEDKGSLKDISFVKRVQRLPTVRGKLTFGLLKAGGKFEWVYKLINKIAFIDAHFVWSLLATRSVNKLYKQAKCSVVLTSSTPYSVHLVGIINKKINPEIFWVADFRDPWTTNYQEILRKRIPGQRWFERKLENSVYTLADAIVVNTEQNLVDLKKEFRLDASKFHVIHNGYDPEYSSLGIPYLERKTGRFRLGFFGGVRGDWYMKPLKTAVKQLQISHPSSYTALEIMMVGTKEYKSQLGIDLDIMDKFVPCGFQERTELPSWLASMDALVLLLPDNGGLRLGWVPQRLYMYLASGLPIVCIAPEGEAATIIRNSGAGDVISPKCIEEIALKLHLLINKEVETNLNRNEEYIASFSKAILASRLNNIITEGQSSTKLSFTST